MDITQTYDALAKILDAMPEPESGIVRSHRRILDRARELNEAWTRGDFREFFYSTPDLSGASFAYDRVVEEIYAGYLVEPTKAEGCSHEERTVLENEEQSAVRLVCTSGCGKMMECDHEGMGRVTKFNGGNPVLLCELCRVIIGPV